MNRLGFIALLLSLTAYVQAQPVEIKHNEPDDTPANFIEVVYRQGNAYILLDSGSEYEPYISLRRNGREIWQVGATLGGCGDDYVVYSLSLRSPVYRISPTTGVSTFPMGVKIGGDLKLQGMYIKGDSLIVLVDGRKFIAREAK